MTTTERDFTKKSNATSGSGTQVSNSQAVQKTALDYVKALRERDPLFERPQVMLMQKEAGKCQPIEDIKKAARRELTKAREIAHVVNESSTVSREPAPEQAKAHGADSATSKSSAPSASSLPPRDSPLTRVFLGQYLSSLVQETIKYRKIGYSDLARQLLTSETLLQDAVQGKLPLKRGRWVRFAQLLELPTTFEILQGERNGAPCWELCYPPTRVNQQVPW